MATVENSFQYRGDLSQTDFPEILYTIDRSQVPGVIEASREGVIKQVFIKEGNVVHATSTDRDDSLGPGCRGAAPFRRGVRGHHAGAGEDEQTLRRAADREEPALPAEVYRAIRKQIEAIVWSLFYWQDGSVIFSIGDFREPDSVRIQLPMRQVILQG